MQINVIDGMMGVGKSSMAIEMINNDKENNYLYITPYLDECKRIKESCQDKHFTEPSNEKLGTKSRHFKELIKHDRNIVSTHALFKGIDTETRDLLSIKDYVLILDEVMNVVEEVEISKQDLKIILEKYVITNERNEMVWTDPNYTGKYEEYKRMCEEGSLILVRDTVIMWKFPAEVFKYFKEVYILTYMFDAQIQKYYFDYYNLQYNYKTIDRDDNNNYIIVEKGQSKFEHEKKIQIKGLVDLYKGKNNNIGKADNALSKTWFINNKDNVLIETLKKNIFNFYKNYCKTKTEKNAWTTFKSFKTTLQGKGYTKGYITLNMRATNEFQDKTSMVYASNMYIKPFLKAVFQDGGVKIDEDKWALSEMLQWIWRGSIRKNEPMKLYIPSKRMRELFERWLNNEI